MPLGFIKSRSDYNKWLEAVKLTKQRKAQRNPEDPNYDPKLKPIQNVFAYANWLYHNVLSESGGLVLEENEIDGPIKSEEHQKIFEWLESKVFNEEKLSSLDETVKWSIVEDLFTEFVNKNPNMPMDKLEEFASFQSGTSSGANNIAALYGMGGYRDEPPVGPIVYGSNQTGLNNPLVNSKLDDDPAIVVIPDKVSKYDPNDFVLDQSGNVVDDIEQSKLSSETEKNQEEGGEYTGDLINILQELGYTIDQLESMDEEDLTNVIKKAFKELQKQNDSQAIKESVSSNISIKQKLIEAFVYDEEEIIDESNTITAAARRLLSNKLKFGKAVKKVNGKYVLNQDEISKLIRSQGYTFSRKYNKWVRKSSPTFWGRKILSTKFQDKDAIKKDESGKYLLNQDAINKKMNDNGYMWDQKKRLWVKKPEKKSEYADQKPAVVEPKKDETSDEKEVETKKDLAPEDQLDSVADAPDIEDDSNDEYEEELNPLQDPSILAKMKYMQARLISGIVSSDSEITDFNKNEEDTWIPTIKDEDVTEKITKLGYEWDATKKVWLDQNLNIPNKVFDIGESKKTIIARSLLAALGKVKNIKVNKSGTPTSDKEKIDLKMENEGFMWSPQLDMWKYLGEDDESEESFEPLNESVLDEAKQQPLKNDKMSPPKRKYKMVDVGEAQARLVMRALQYAWYKKASKVDKSKADQIWNADMKDGMDGDAMNDKMDISVVEDWLRNTGNYEFNKDEAEPMWVDKSNPNDMPGILSMVGINSKEEYIARGILASSKRPEYVHIRASSPDKPNMRVPSDKVEMRMKENGLSWNDEWGWVEGDGSSTPSKGDLSNQSWMEDRSDIPWNSMNKQDQKKYKELLGYRIASKLSGKSPKDWNSMSPKERNKAMFELEKHYEFNQKTKQFIQRDKPLSTGLLSKIGKIAGNAGSWLGNAIKSVATNMGRYN
jgi:hypothetical protein